MPCSWGNSWLAMLFGRSANALGMLWWKQRTQWMHSKLQRSRSCNRSQGMQVTRHKLHCNLRRNATQASTHPNECNEWITNFNASGHQCALSMNTSQRMQDTQGFGKPIGVQVALSGQFEVNRLLVSKLEVWGAGSPKSHMTHLRNVRPHMRKQFHLWDLWDSGVRFC